MTAGMIITVFSMSTLALGLSILAIYLAESKK